MDDLLRQIDAASGSRVFYLALMGALTVPDVAGALAHPSGTASPARYEGWVRANLPRWSTGNRPQALYQYRNAMLHQHRATPDPRKKLPRLLFQEPNARTRLHGAELQHHQSSAIVIDVQKFCADMTNAARHWLDEHLTDSVVITNRLQSIKRHPDGVPPFIQGIPIIG